jgi:uncharacterized delta-60 repeat protein
VVLPVEQVEDDPGGTMIARLRTSHRLPGLTCRLTSAVLATACLALWGSATPPASAAPGDLDPSFGYHGKVFDGDQGYESPTAQFSDITMVGDKIIGVGEAGVTRYNPDGSPDDSFSFQYDEPIRIKGIAALPSGKLVIAGGTSDYYSAYSDREDFAVARLESNGSLDTTFAGGDPVELDFEHQDDTAQAVAPDAHGRVVVVGVATSLDSDDAPARDFSIARLNPDGSLDPSFSGDGKRTVDIGDDVAYDVAIQPNGKIVVAGSSSGDFAVARLKPDGSLDRTFSGDGIATAGFSGSNGDGAQALALQNDGRIVLGGGDAQQFALARFTPNGSLDPSFSRDGQLTTDIAPDELWYVPETAYDVALEGSRILVAGTANDDFAVARYTPAGDLDRSFSGDGTLTTDFGDDDTATAIVLAPDGKIVVGGAYFTGDYKYYSAWSGVIARYLVDDRPADSDADGVPDASDLCPNVFAPDTTDGCPLYDRTLTLDIVKRHRYAYLKATLEGRLKECLDETHVEIYRVRRGRTKTIRAAWIRQAGTGKRRLYEARVRKLRARFHAAAEEQVVSTVGRCSAATSNVIRLRRR